MNSNPSALELYGILAEYPDAETLLDAARQVHHEGYTATDAFAPFPVDGLSEALGDRGSSVPWVMLVGGCVGGGAAYGLQYWISVIAYPLNVGGRPLHSWPAFIPATFETAVLLASLAGLIGMLGICGLPRLHHPLFEIPQFQRASSDAFFLCIEARDRRFDPLQIRRLLMRCGASEVWDVPQGD